VVSRAGDCVVLCDDSDGLWAGDIIVSCEGGVAMGGCPLSAASADIMGAVNTRTANMMDLMTVGVVSCMTHLLICYVIC
jgi:hypothetical protein